MIIFRNNFHIRAENHFECQMYTTIAFIAHGMVKKATFRHNWKMI